MQYQISFPIFLPVTIILSLLGPPLLSAMIYLIQLQIGLVLKLLMGLHGQSIKLAKPFLKLLRKLLNSLKPLLRLVLGNLTPIKLEITNSGSTSVSVSVSDTLDPHIDDESIERKDEDTPADIK